MSKVNFETNSVNSPGAVIN